jgi:MoxR-like ATPase
MGEGQVTVDGTTHTLNRPFLVLATQNPIEYEGTFPLPEAQLDRFMLRISLGYPNKEDEQKILDAQQFKHPIEDLAQVVTVEELVEAQEQIKQVHIDDLIKTYIVELVSMTRDHPDAYLGASPRGSITLYKTAQVRAAMEGRDFAIPDDIKALTPAALAHRLIVSPSARIKDVDPRAVVDDVLQSVPVPGARSGRGRARNQN